MANFRALARHFPAILDYPGSRKWTRRGDVLSYAPGIRTPSVSTDTLGFRHSLFEGAEIGLADMVRFAKVGLVLGSSHVFGYGLPGNDKTLASRLSERLGYPVLGISFPEADSRSLHAVLQRLLRAPDRKIAFALMLSGGDLTRYCFTRRADPLFGPPGLPLGEAGSTKLDEGPADDAQAFANLLQFVGFWTTSLIALSAEARLRLVFADDVTWFEKTQPDAIERDCAFGRSASAGQQGRFDAHLARYARYAAHRREVIAQRGGTLVDFPPANDLLFIDEYHYRAESQSLIADRLAPALA